MSQATSGASRVSGAPVTCLLLIGDRVVVRATSTPEAEYALFEIGEIELRASEPGRVREHGYQTTADLARTRLANLGMTSAVAHDLARALQPVLSDAYARGAAVRRVARYLSPTELFQSDTYDGSAHVYRGVFLDLAALVRDIDMEHASATLHALYLATLLESEKDDVTVILSTDQCTKGGKPGARTYKRPTFADPKRLMNALGGLAHRHPQPEITETLPREDVIAFLRSRAELAADEDARALYKSLEGSVSIRDMPDKGPLASPDLWAVELRIEAGDTAGLLETIEELERRHGRTPGTTYLRARVSLALGLEPAQKIAEKVSALAISIGSFQELALLAAEAWIEAGDARRAIPYARDLVDSSGLDDGLLLRAQRLLARAVGAAPQKTQTVADLQAAPRPSRPPGTSGSRAPLPDLTATGPSDFPRAPMTLDPPDVEGTTPKVPPVESFETNASAHMLDPDDLVPVQSSPTPLVSPHPPTLEPPPRPSRGLPPPMPPSRPSRGAPAPAHHSSASRPAERDPRRPPSATTPLAAREPSGFGLTAPPEGTSFTLDLPAPEAPPGASSAPPAQGPRPSRRPRLSGVMMETRPPASFDPRAEPDSPVVHRASSSPQNRRVPVPSPLPGPAPARRAKARGPSDRPVIDDSPHERPTPLRPPSEGETLEAPTLISDRPAAVAAADIARPYMHGASLPPYRHEHPPPLLPKAPLLPRLASDELAEHLALPPGIDAEQRSLDKLPSSVLEARIQFTLLARELGLDYRLKRGIELRADLTGIEAMQSVLLESFPDHVVKTSDEAYELRRHGALLSEILSRKLDAEWLDISPNELGYWVMIVPPDTRVWPFGRIARFVAMGHKERDLVSYFLELEARARGR